VRVTNTGKKGECVGAGVRARATGGKRGRVTTMISDAPTTSIFFRNMYFLHKMYFLHIMYLIHEMSFLP